ncbi:MAG TPA: branched-chain amino acid ABC transporter permease [Candidatus Limnocylindria bacterium]|nr:branched-chain amino acid ABC transporter permease [Candidatus Limnocylindria bacterium]
MGAVLWALRIAVLVGVLFGSWATISSGRLDTDDWLRLAGSGLSLGAIYALIALGYTLVYGVLFIVNFAHGEVFMMGAFAGMFTAAGLAEGGLLDANPAVGLVIIFAAAMLTSMLVAVILERIAYRPLRRAPRLVPLITAIGASLFLQYTALGFFGPQSRRYPEIDFLAGRVNLIGASFRVIELVTIVAAVVLMFALYYFVERTRTGRAMRAVSEDKDVAALMGIDVDRIIVTTFAIGGLLAGAAGVLYALLFNRVEFVMGLLPGIKAFTAAVLGGIGNIVGAMLGGVALGLLENVGPSLLLLGVGVPATNQLRDVVAFSVLVLVLVFRPTGLLGRRESV